MHKQLQTFTIQEVSQMLSITKPTLRFWEREFKNFLEPLRTPGNQRRYDEEAIENIKRINHLVKVEGFTIEGAKKKLEAMEQ